MMKRTILAVFAVLVFSLTASAQFKPYPKSLDESDYQIDVKVKGQRPQIRDFVSAFLRDEMSEVFGTANEAWQNHLRGKAVGEGITITDDEKNGYVRFEIVHQDDGSYEQSTIEMCYWNCKDGKHKLIAESTRLLLNGYYVETEMTGTQFFLYNNATRKMYNIGLSDLGIDIDPLYEPGTQAVVFELPQKGKNITVKTYRQDGNKKQGVLEWDGMRFKLKR